MKIDSLFQNGRIFTMDPDRPQAQTMGVLNGYIVGFDDEVDDVASDVVVDLGHAPVYPGFHDAHNHLSQVGQRLGSLNLRPGVVDTLSDLYDAVRDRAPRLAENEWIKGAGYDDNVLGSHPSADQLDQVAGGRPVVLEHVSGHMLVANTAAFARAGYSEREGVPNISGGFVSRDGDGRASGLLQERATEIIETVLKPLPQDEVLHNLELASNQALAYGLTSVTEPGVGSIRGIGNSPIDIHLYQTAVERGILGPRMTVMPYYMALHEFSDLTGQDWFGLDLGIRTGLGNDRLAIGPTKILSDGSFIGRSAAMHQCYMGEPDNTGFMQLEPAALRDAIISAHAAGWTVATHAIGNAAIDHVLSAIEAAQRTFPRPGVRHRIEHFALTSDEQVARAAQNNVIGVPQGSFISDFGDGMRGAVGDSLTGSIYRMMSLQRNGMVLPGSTDAPVSDGNPLASIHDMVNRTTTNGHVLGPDEAVSARDAVRAYTYGSAYAVNQEGRKGTLTKGKLADFVLLSDDLSAIEPSRIWQQTVGATYISGECVYNDGAVTDN